MRKRLRTKIDGSSKRGSAPLWGLVQSLDTRTRMTQNIGLYEKRGYPETGRKTEQGYARVHRHKLLSKEFT